MQQSGQLRKGDNDMDWKFWLIDVALPIATFVAGLFTGKTIERKSKAKSKIKGDGNTVIQNSDVKK